MASRGNFFHKNSKMLISSKSCSRCGRSTILEDRSVKLKQILAKKHEKNRGGEQHRKTWGLATKLFVLSAFLVNIWVLSGSSVATQNDTRVWVPLRTDASVAAPGTHRFPFGGLGSPFHVFLEFSMLQ